MRLKSLTLKGFKSFPDRTRLDFGPGVSVVVGPNGSGKSNVTDAVLWAMGEQSPLAVRGQSMQDVIFGGGRGVQARSAAEVEIVLDNSDGTVDLPLSEISIVRRLDRAGEGGYRLNGARCRLTDVIEVLSDTGLGKEHAFGHLPGPGRGDRDLQAARSAPADRGGRRAGQAPQAPAPRAAEARAHAGEPRSRARRRARGAHAAAPAQAPGRGGRAARATGAPAAGSALDARVRDVARARRGSARGRDAGARRASSRELVEAELQAIVARRGRAETALAERTERHDALSRRAYEIRSARERLALRGEQAQASAVTLAERASRIEIELGALTVPPDAADAASGAGEAPAITWPRARIGYAGSSTSWRSWSASVSASSSARSRGCRQSASGPPNWWAS